MTTHTAEEVAALLEAGARASDSPFQQAAIHLLTYTDLPGRADLQPYLDIEDVDLNGQSVPAAWIRDWHGIGKLKGLGHLHGGAERLVRLAASMAHGEPVDLSATLSGLGHAHARRVLEAVAICSGADEFYEITETPALQRNNSFLAALLGETSPTGEGRSE
ncbi:hypothetical protein [Nocardia camponoti]|uniref:Uncharacterized protein n=1 Tax=Nocardia camponoti TaxID=1616106 RepID=A0A917VF35_9NOCA|nr:hypothetical protein [Nocardia camponoti]GGK69213.1 hypothetical protein GCM10011591_46680 [Nocardia camponoti]